MDLFGFVSWALVVVLGATLAWPLNTAALALAYKARLGPRPVPLAAGEFWLRCAAASLAVAAWSAVMLGIVYLAVGEGQLPQGPAHLALLLLYLPAAVGLVFWILALEDMMEGLSVFLLYVLIAGLPLLLVGRLTGLWRRLGESAAWLLPSS